MSKKSYIPKEYDLNELNNKYSLNVNEASYYYGIGQQQLRKLADIRDNKFTLRVGRKLLFKRELFSKYLEDRNRI